MLNVGRIVRKQKVIQPPPSEISTRKSASVDLSDVLSSLGACLVRREFWKRRWHWHASGNLHDYGHRKFQFRLNDPDALHEFDAGRAVNARTWTHFV
jgi:hypothetical protein